MYDTECCCIECRWVRMSMPAAAAWETDSQVFEVGKKGVSDYSKVVDE